MAGMSQAEHKARAPHSVRCAIITVNVPGVVRVDLENWLWKKHNIRIRGGDPSKLRLSTPYYIQKPELDRFLDRFDEFKKGVART